MAADAGRPAHARAEEPALIQVPPGLAGVAVAETAIGDVRGHEGFYHYRGLDATELARTRTLEQVWELLVDGRADDTRAGAFADEVAVLREVPEAVVADLPALARLGQGADPLSGLRTALSATGTALELAPLWDRSPAGRRHDVLAVAAVVPSLLAGLHRTARGLTPVTPPPGLGHVASYLFQLTGKPAPDSHVTALSRYLVAAVDHGFNASTFTARVVASTGADAAACAVAGIGALSGPLHGGAPSRAVEMLDAIGSVENADAWLTSTLDRGERLMGFGHAVYRTEDPRSRLLRDTVVAMRPDLDQRRRALVDLALAVERKALAALAERRPDRPLATNVEFYAGVLMECLGLPRELFSATFAVARSVGWSAHVLEQTRDRKIVRPSARYVGTS